MKNQPGATKGKQGGSGGSKRLFGGSNESDAGQPGFDWGSVEPAVIAKLIELVTGRGGAIRFGYSRDGQAGAIGVYYGDQRDTVYIRPNQDFSDAIGVIERTFEALPYSAGVSPDQGR